MDFSILSLKLSIDIFKASLLVFSLSILLSILALLLPKTLLIVPKESVSKMLVTPPKTLFSMPVAVFGDRAVFIKPFTAPNIVSTRLDTKFSTPSLSISKMPRAEDTISPAMPLSPSTFVSV